MARATLFTLIGGACAAVVSCGPPFVAGSATGGGDSSESATGGKTSSTGGQGGQGGSTASTSSTSTSSTSSTGGNGGASSSTSVGGGGSGGGCDDSQKLCSQSCVQKSDPDFGCAAVSCEPCSTSHSTPSCSNGSCKVSCDADFGDCNHSASDGCEVNVTNTKAHCGSCGHACT
ncbi:MAG: hypothetical protein WA001_03140, partial [Patescibacteria group bacterium]